MTIPATRASVALAIALSMLAAPLRAQSDGASAPGHTRPITIAHAVRATGPIELDGLLDESAWQSAPVTDSFTQINPDEGKPASQKTEVRVVYDDQALYVGVRLHDTGQIIARLGRRDMPLGDSDWFGLMIDSYHDHRTAFGFDVNPAGVRRDEVKTIDVDDNSWDAVWRVATRVDSAGWTVEYRVPFSQLRFSNDSVQTWGVQFERVIGRNQEYSVSTFIPKSIRGGVPQYGHLEGLRDIAAGKRLEVLPYVVSKAEYIDPGLNPYRDKSEYQLSGGVDLRYRVASNLTLNATFNPDFGQVEVDPAVINLGVYETFFDEKRPFFLEGSEIFDFGAGGTSGGQLFYSRRIGRAPSLVPPTPLADVPTTTTILGAGKLSGKMAGWSIGALTAVTAREQARFRDDGGIDERMTVEPLSGYVVTRARRELNGGRSLIGGTLTAVKRDLNTDVLRDNFRSSALAGGVDFRHEWANRSWVVRGDAEFSRIAGNAASILSVQRASNHYFQRPDATHLDLDSTATSLFGYSMNAELTKQAGEHWRGSLAGALTSPGYEVNDLGFSYRTDRRDVEASIRYLENAPGKLLRNWSVTTDGRFERNYANQPIQTLATLSASARTLDYWSLQLQLQRSFEAVDDRLTRGGPRAIRPAANRLSAFVSSDVRQPVTGELQVFGERSDFGGSQWNAGLTLGLKTSTSWNLSIGPTLLKLKAPAQYVATIPDAAYQPTFGARYVFAPIEQTEVGLETRLNVTFTPELSLQTYVQPLISSVDYGDAIQLVRPNSFDFEPYAAAVPDLDFNLRSLRGNAVLRWEWRPGSTIYVAWQQSRQDIADVGDFSFGRDRRALFGTRPDNIFLVKVDYWLNP
ncbi:MAG TPA: DUF5916 domain-containing protein [Gemmatimonadaceae bacterium]|nr:DUF5916 domain-containing protein [Gemmatimonadaceae bacterium]